MRRKRLRYIIIRPDLKADDPVDDLGFRRKKNNGDIAGLSDLRADIPSADIREHDIENDQIRVLLFKKIQRFAARIGGNDPHPFFFKISPQTRRDRLIIVTEQNAQFIIHNKASFSSITASTAQSA